jgi:hypothetical protein
MAEVLWRDHVAAGQTEGGEKVKAEIVSTDAVVMISDPDGRKAMARVWEGLTEAGIPFTAYITNVQVHKNCDCTEFARALQENKPPAPDTQRAIDMRFVL